MQVLHSRYQPGEGGLPARSDGRYPGPWSSKALIVTDRVLNKIGVVARLSTLPAEHGIDSVVFDETKPNPTVANVEAGLAMIQAHGCDCVISLGGGSPHDCAKGIALVAANGGGIKDYEGVDRSAKPQLPLIAINTTAGTASEMIRFCIITDESRHVRMAIIDKHVPPDVGRRPRAEAGQTRQPHRRHRGLGPRRGDPGMAQLGVRADDFDALADNALKDACGFTDPKQASHAEIVAIFRAAM